MDIASIINKALEIESVALVLCLIIATIWFYRLLSEYYSWHS